MPRGSLPRPSGGPAGKSPSSSQSTVRLLSHTCGCQRRAARETHQVSSRAEQRIRARGSAEPQPEPLPVPRESDRSEFVQRPPALHAGRGSSQIARRTRCESDHAVHRGRLPGYHASAWGTMSAYVSESRLPQSLRSSRTRLSDLANLLSNLTDTGRGREYSVFFEQARTHPAGIKMYCLLFETARDVLRIHVR